MLKKFLCNYIASFNTYNTQCTPFFLYYYVSTNKLKVTKMNSFTSFVVGESTLRVNHFCSKKVMYNKYYNT